MTTSPVHRPTRLARLTMVLVAAAVGSIAMAVLVGASASPSAPRFDLYTAEARLEVDRLADDAPVPPSDADKIGVLEFRHACRTLAIAARAQGRGGTLDAVRALPAQAREVGQDQISTLYATQLVPAAESGDWETVEAFVVRDCDPDQDHAKPVRR